MSFGRLNSTFLVCVCVFGRKCRGLLHRLNWNLLERRKKQKGTQTCLKQLPGLHLCALWTLPCESSANFLPATPHSQQQFLWENYLKLEIFLARVGKGQKCKYTRASNFQHCHESLLCIENSAEDKCSGSYR